jgi:hypothetical protein
MLDASGTTDVAEKQKHDGLVNLLTPIVKAYTSDQAWRVAELAIQVHGGYGYTKDFPVEQYARDVKILSIWEGTNYVQAVDLLRDKLAMGNNRQLLAQYLAEIEGFLNRTDAPQNPLHQKLRDSVSALTDTVAVISDLVRAKKIETVLLYATRFLGMMSTVTIGWLLLEAATIAERALANIPDDHPDVSFYRGKILSAQFFFGQFVPSVLEDAGRIRVGEDSVLGADSSVFLI